MKREGLQWSEGAQAGDSCRDSKPPALSDSAAVVDTLVTSPSTLLPFLDSVVYCTSSFSPPFFPLLKSQSNPNLKKKKAPLQQLTKLLLHLRSLTSTLIHRNQSNQKRTSISFLILQQIHKIYLKENKIFKMSNQNDSSSILPFQVPDHKGQGESRSVIFKREKYPEGWKRRKRRDFSPHLMLGAKRQCVFVSGLWRASMRFLNEREMNLRWSWLETVTTDGTTWLLLIFCSPFWLIRWD